MPLRDRDRTRPRRLVRLGVIRLGYKKKKMKTRKDGSKYEVEYPVQADHFVLTDAPEIAAAYRDKPRELDVLLPFPDIERNFDAAYKVWAGGVLVCRGDGEYVESATPYKIVEKETGIGVHNAPGDTLVSDGVAQIAFEWNGESFKAGDHVPCPGMAAEMYPHCAACRVSAILKVMMAKPELFRLGYYQIATGSGRNYDTILGTLELIYQMAGRVSGVPFKLRLVKEPTIYREHGRRKKTEKWFLQLEPQPEFMREVYRREAARILGQGEPVARLSAGEPEPDDWDEWDEPEPPPVAEETLDIETGEIITNETEAPENAELPEADETELAHNADWAAQQKTSRGTLMSKMNVDQLQWILDNPQRAKGDQVEAAGILLDAISVELAEKESEDPNTDVSTAEATFQNLVLSKPKQERML